MQIRVMEPADLPVALDVINQEGWGYTASEIERMLKLEPQGSFIYVAKEPIGAITTVVHGNIGVIGHLVVSRKARGRGVGGALLARAMEHLRARGSDTVVVIATDEGRPLYSKFGFKVEREILCKHFILDGFKTTHKMDGVVPMRKGDLKEVAEIDGELFGAARPKLIGMLYDEAPESCFKCVGPEGISGFSMGRSTTTGFDLGPWMCRPGYFGMAEALLDSTLSTFPNGRIFSGLFADNKEAVRITEKLPLFRFWSTKLMVSGRPTCYPHVDQLFGIAAFELG